MIAKLRGCLTLLTASVLIFGCSDPQAAVEQELQKKYQASLDKIAQANRGFTDGQSGKAADVAAFRAQLLTQVAAELNGLIGQGSPVQQLAIARTLGQTHGALAMHQTHLAQMQWAALWNMTSELMQKVALASGAQVRVQVLEVDQEPGLITFREFQTGLNQQAQQAQSRTIALAATLAQLQARQKNLISQRDEILSQVQALNQKAFTLTGQAQFETYQAALAAERQAQQLDAEAEKLHAQIGVQQAELNIARQIAQLAAANAQWIESQSQAMAQRQSDATAQRQTMIGDEQTPASVKSRERDLIEALTQVLKNYRQQVQPAFDRADQSAAQSIAMIEKALSLTSGDATRRRNLQADLLAAIATRLEVQSRWIAAMGNLARVLIVVDARLTHALTLGDQAQPLRDQIAEFQKSLARAVAESSAIKTKSDELAGQLSTPDSDTDAMSAFVNAQNLRISQAAAWIEASSKM